MEEIKNDKLMVVILADLEQSEMILIGIGDEFSVKTVAEDELILLYNDLGAFLGKKNYFIVSTIEDGMIFKSRLNPKRIAAPFYMQEEAGEKQWNFYNIWLQATLNHKLTILEFGEGFQAPNVIRWPFEKVTMVNNKARFYRVNKSFAQIPEDIHHKSEHLQTDAVTFAASLLRSAQKR